MATSEEQQPHVHPSTGIPCGRELPILFTGPMVRAIQAGAKTVTRRVVKPQPYYLRRLDWGRFMSGLTVEAKAEELAKVLPKPHWSPGDCLWVRETWRQAHQSPEVHYRADLDEPEAPGCWRPSIFMPKHAARLFLPVVSVRAEFLLDITEEEALAEGVSRTVVPPVTAPGTEWGTAVFHVGEWPARRAYDSARAAFLAGWDRINPKYPAAENPVVWRIEFRFPGGADRG